MKILKKALPILLAFCMLFGAVSLAADSTDAAPTQTMVPEKIDGTVAGTVIHVEENDIIINMDNGNTVMFMLNYLHVTDAAVGDKVAIDFSGNVIDSPEAINIIITEKALSEQTISGTVAMFDDTRVFVAISSGNVFGFTLDKDSTVTGKAKALVVGSAVTVTYLGDLDAIPYAKGIEITKAAKAAKKAAADEPKDKALDGYVRSLSSTKLTLHTNSGKNYTFGIKKDTKVSGNYALETGSKVRITYDGYAGKNPPATAIKVLSPADPTPPSPKHHTTKGTVESHHGVFLTLTNGNAFNCTYASHGGNSDGEEGDKAKVTYYIGDDGVYYATKVVFTSNDYDPVPVPNPVPDPDPEPDPVIFGEEG